MRSAFLLTLTLLAPATLAQQATAPAPLEPVDFDQAVQRAVEHSTSAAVAVQEVARTDALLWEARSGSLPLLSANATYTRIDHERRGTALVPTGNPSDPVRSIDTRTGALQQNNENLAVSAPLLAPSRWFQWSHASDQLDVSRASQRDVRRVVSLTAARAYLTIIAQKRAIEVSRRAVDTAARHAEYAHTRRAGGVGNALDEARADQQLATAQAQLENAVAGLARAQEALGIATGAAGPLDARGEPDLGGGPASVEEGSRAAEEMRTDVRLARERSAAAHRVARDSWGDWAPTLTLNAQVYRQDPPTSALPAHGWQAQLALNFPFFEGGLRVGQLRERQALEREARLQLEGTVLQARADVRTAYSNLEHAQNGLEQNRRAADRANAALSIVEKAFRAGATTSLDVTDAERTARDADSAAVVAEDGVRQARLDLLAATGKFPVP
jgi:outer membrane protein